MENIYFEAIPRKAIWAERKLKEYLGRYDYPDGVGQSWVFAVQGENATSIVEDGEYKGKSLSDIWNKHQELFESKYDRFPFIIGFTGPEDTLSIQVHPDDEFAKNHNLPSGKNECWYFIECEKDADLILGMNAKDKNELLDYMNKNKWEELIRRIPMKNEDFIFVPAGLLHAMQKGVIVYEVQEATDITYRFYDFDRKDKDGNKRELHQEAAIECIRYDLSDKDCYVTPINKEHNNLLETIYLNNKCFEIIRLRVCGESSYSSKKYLLATVVKGKGSVDGKQVGVGDSFLVPIKKEKIELSGQMDIMITCERD